jgi:ribokinase
LDGDAVRTALARLEALGGGSGGGGDPGTRGEAGDAEAGGEGVLLTGFEIGDDAVLAAVSWAAERGLRIVLNPAPSRPLLPGIAATRPILTPNASEAAALGGQRDDADAGHAAHAAHAAHLLPALTGAPVVVTLGEDGALLLDDGGSTVIPALPVDVVDATGAGDALNGILAAELASGSSVEAAARRGVAGASLSTMKTGARAGLPTATEIDLALESDADSLRTANEG